MTHWEGQVVRFTDLHDYIVGHPVSPTGQRHENVAGQLRRLAWYNRELLSSGLVVGCSYTLLGGFDRKLAGDYEVHA